MTNLIFPKGSGRKQSANEFESKGPSLPRIVAEAKSVTKELFMHPAEKPQFNGPVYRGFRVSL